MMSQSSLASAPFPVYLVRHGQTEWNAERRFQGQRDVRLNATGRQQAHAVAAWLARQPVDFRALHTSDSARSCVTAQVIGRRFGLTPVQTPELREIDTGEWTGLTRDDIEHIAPGRMAKWRESFSTFAFPGGESAGQVIERMLAYYRECLAAHRGGGMLIVSHGTGLGGFLSVLLGWDVDVAFQQRQTRFHNTGVTIVRYDPATDTHNLVAHNLTEHLQTMPSV